MSSNHTNKLTNFPILSKNVKSIDSNSFFALKVKIVSGILRKRFNFKSLLEYCALVTKRVKHLPGKTIELKMRAGGRHVSSFHSGLNGFIKD